MSCDKDGKITAIEFDFGVDYGAYDDISMNLHFPSGHRCPGYFIPPCSKTLSHREIPCRIILFCFYDRGSNTDDGNGIK
jgi:hypothetical protein